MAEPTVHRHKARKQWPCKYERHMIQPGEEYLSQSWPPWTMVPTDTDGDGNTLYDQLGTWVTERYHAACRDRAEGYGT